MLVGYIPVPKSNDDFAQHFGGWRHIEGMADGISIDELLAHSAWMRNLAVRLVRDESAADDLVQESWEIALKQPHVRSETVRPWLGQILRNLARAKFRSGSRRARREDFAIDKDAQVSSAEELVSSLEVQRLLADQILALAEPYRSTILLSFYEGLSSADIAAREGVPSGTVRWRLKTAIEQLRERLDRNQPAGRSAWIHAMIPLVSPKNHSMVLGKPIMASSLKGAVTMKIGTSAVAVGAVVATMLLVKPWTKAQSSLEINSPIKVNTDSSEPASEVGRLIPDPKIIQSHDEFLKKVEAARAVRLTRESQGNTRSKNATEPQTAEEAILDSDYIQTQLKELEPLFLECYNKALRHDSAAGGRLSIMLSIAGDSTVGGIIAESNIVDDSEESIADPEFRLCVQESIYAARFPPPKGSGEVKLTKPLRFFFHSDDNENQPK